MMQPLQGSFVALVTPMNADGSLDHVSLKELVDWHVQAGTNGIVSVGTTGESATVNVSEHLEVIERTIQFSGGRIPVIAGTGANSTQEAIELTQIAENLGADFALIVTPYYNRPNQEGLLKHYLKIADTIDIPQILYNVPSRTACDLLPETVNQLVDHPNIVGIKEAVTDLDRLDQLIHIANEGPHKENFYVLSGDDPSFNSFMNRGGDGVISVAANIIPKEISQICSLNLEQCFEDAGELNKIFERFYELLFIESNPIPVKWMLQKMTKIQPGIRLPLVPLNERLHEMVTAEMLKLKLI